MAKSIHRYFKVFKPYGMLSQFTSEAGHKSLNDLSFKFPKDAYPVGRLDHDSEGLILLTNDSRVNKLLLDPNSKKEKTYWVQVEGIPKEDALEELRGGVVINLKGTLHKTKPASVKKISAPGIPERNPTVNYIKHPDTSWIEIKITEGKNHQVRKMTAKIGHPTLRLIRYAMENISVEGMKSGDVNEIKQEQFFSALKLMTVQPREFTSPGFKKRLQR